ncbi:MAG: 50S ribosomal protein L13 [bacterium]
MNMTTKTSIPKNPGETRQWLLVDAAQKPLGRLAVIVANKLRGKDRPDFDPSVDIGDFVVVVNAEKVKLTGRKEEQKKYQRYSGYRGGLREFSVATMRERHPDRIIKLAVWGMLPKNLLSKKVMTRLKVFRGAEHTHAPQNPKKIELA